ncbi:MAG: hypothetical protein ACW967_03800 [Candidatus Hodarchaeales archaeon]|jgi:hypothetical protein
MFSTTHFKKHFLNFFGNTHIIAKHPPKNMIDGSIMFSEDIPIQLLSLSNDLESELSGLEPGLVGKAKGWVKTPSRWILLAEWSRRENIFEVALIYGLDSWKVIKK